MWEREAAVLIWDELRPNEMHLPMRCFVSDSQRGDIAPGEESAFDEKRAVEESVRMEGGVRLMLESRRNALRGGAAVVFMVRS